MEAAFYLLTIVGILGSYDVLYWHWYRLKLFQYPESRMENVTHAIRALLFALMMLMVLHVDARGWWWPIYPVLLAGEVTNTVADVLLEPKSRRNIGGLPPVEYVIHIILSILTGGALASVIWGTWNLLTEPSYLGFRTLPAPVFVLFGAYMSVVIALAMFVFELRGVFRVSRQARKGLTTGAKA
jgi:hypothetical protein